MVGEDQPIVREGIVHVLEDGGFEVVATAGDARELVNKVRTYRPDVVVTDIQMPPDRTDDGLRGDVDFGPGPQRDPPAALHGRHLRRPDGNCVDRRL